MVDMQEFQTRIALHYPDRVVRVRGEGPWGAPSMVLTSNGEDQPMYFNPVFLERDIGYVIEETIMYIDNRWPASVKPRRELI